MPWATGGGVAAGNAPFTEARAEKLDNLTDRFKGIYADADARDAAVPTPLSGDYVKQNDTSTFWFYGDDGWVDSNDTSTGNMVDTVYDPQGVGKDVFDRENHEGDLPIGVVAPIERLSFFSRASAGGVFWRGFLNDTAAGLQIGITRRQITGSIVVDVSFRLTGGPGIIHAEFLRGAGVSSDGWSSGDISQEIRSQVVTQNQEVDFDISAIASTDAYGFWKGDITAVVDDVAYRYEVTMFTVRDGGINKILLSGRRTG